MSRHYTSDGYERRDGERRLTRYAHEQQGRDRREQQIARYVGENSYYPRERRNTAYPGDFHESVEIKVARSARNPGGKTHSILESEPKGNREDRDREDFPLRGIDRRSTRETKEFAASASARDGCTNVSIARGIRPYQDATQTEEAAEDRPSLSGRRCNWNETRISDEQVDPSTEQQKMRNALEGRDSLSAQDSQRPTFSPVYHHINKYFLPGEGIDREFIRTNVTKYLGPDAHCVPHVNREARIIFAFVTPAWQLTEYRGCAAISSKPIAL